MFGFNIDALIMVPTKAMLAKAIGFVPTIVAALLILIVGLIVVRIARLLIDRALEALHFEHFSKNSGLADILRKGDVGLSASEIVGHLAYCVGVIMVFLLVLNLLGIALPTHLLDGFVGYVPTVLTAVFVMILGIFFANFTSVIVRAAAKNAGFKRTDILEDISRFAIVIFALVIVLKELGMGWLFAGDYFMILFGGIVLSLSIAFGLGGKDMAGKYLKDLRK